LIIAKTNGWSFLQETKFVKGIRHEEFNESMALVTGIERVGLFWLCGT